MTYLKLAGIAKAELTKEHITRMLELIENDSRVKEIRPTDDPIRFYFVADEIESGEYTVGKICNHLNELPSTRKARLEIENKVLPDVINITNFMKYKDRTDSSIRNLPIYTRNRLKEAIENCEPSHDKAQLVNTLNFKLQGNETIADRILRDHVNVPHAKRHARLLLQAGCANEINRREYYFGTFIFEDGSKL